MVGETAHIVVGFDHSGIAQAGFDHIWVDGPLDQEIHRSDLLRLFFKYTDELCPDDLPLLLRLFCAGQLTVKTLLGIDPDEVQLVGAFRPEHRLHLIALVLAQQAVIHEDTGQLAADSL